MVFTVMAIFKFQEGKKQEFLDMLNGPEGLSITRAWEGCQAIEMYQSKEDSNHVFIWQKWKDKSNHESYVQMRKESGMFDKLHKMADGEIQIYPLAELDELSQSQSA